MQSIKVFKTPPSHEGWICTDPDSQQYGVKITDKIFSFREPDRQGTVNLDDYEIKEQEHIINAYGYTLAEGADRATRLLNVKEHYKDSANWIIAECIFETEF